MSGRDLRSVRRRVSRAAGASLLSVTLGAAAFVPPSQAAPVTISGASPFPGLAACGNFPGDPADNATVFLDSEVEPFLAVNPGDARNLVAVWQQDRWSNGGSRGNAFATSEDGGRRWSTPAGLPRLTTCSVPAGTWQRATDPWVTFAPDGTAYAFSIGFQALPPPSRPGGDGANAMLVHRSTDRGRSWSDPIELIRDVDPRFFNDKNAITADPTDSRFVYAVWDRLASPNGVVINPENVFGLGFKGPVTFARTTNGGQSWEPARTIYDPGANNQTIGNQIAVRPGGTVIDFFNEILNFKNADGSIQFDFNLSFIFSNDKGSSWLPKGPPRRVQKIQTLALFRTFGVITPDLQRGVRSGDILFDVAVNRSNGNLYAVWQDARFSGFQIDEVAFSQSTDGGSGWSPPIKVNKTPVRPNILRSQAFTPSVEVRGDGTVVVTYYDFRNDNDNGELAEYFGVTCASQCSSPGSWGSETKLSRRPFDMLAAPLARGLFTGDYEGLAADTSNGLAAWSQPDGDAGDILFERY